MDYRRLMLAIAAQEIQDVEARRLLLVRGQIHELTPQEEERIAQHDALIGATGDEMMDGEA